MTNPIVALVSGFLRGLADGMVADEHPAAATAAPIVINIEQVTVTESADITALVTTLQTELATRTPAPRLPWRR